MCKTGNTIFINGAPIYAFPQSASEFSMTTESAQKKFNTTLNYNIFSDIVVHIFNIQQRLSYFIKKKLGFSFETISVNNKLEKHYIRKYINRYITNESMAKGRLIV